MHKYYNHWYKKDCGIFLLVKQKVTSPGGLEPPTFWLTAERANRLRHGDYSRRDLFVLLAYCTHFENIMDMSTFNKYMATKS